jgi:peptide/nickel transport system permease protein
VMLALPSLLISIGIVAACNSSPNGCLGGTIQQGLRVVIAVIALFTWPYMARIVRGFTLSLREKEFVEASRSLGASNLRIIWREIMPNLIGPIIVYTTLLIPQNILFEAALSYLGLGVNGDTASWGGLLNDAQTYYDVAWWLMLFPGLFLVLTTLAFNLLGDGLRDALDVRADR